MTEVTSKSSFVRRDRLCEMEAWAQAQWAAQRAFEKDAPAECPDEDRKKFLATFPYPYMNGRLHVGHAFTITKAEFATRFHQLKGEEALFPYGFHCTGMPIQAAAGNLKRELEEVDEAEESNAAPSVSADQSADIASSRLEAGVFKSAKSKAKSKTGGLSQYDIMRSMDIPESEIPSFVDPTHWLSYFPPLGQEDLNRFGVAVDWRRSFITTERNPYYDAFVRWQFRKLRAAGKILFGNRPAIFARREKQPCADHDRASGEGVGHQEYTLIKLRVQVVPETWKSLLSDTQQKHCFLVAATLRPETMYGQTNCFVLPEGDYGLYGMNNDEVFICSQRSADNMVWQGMGPRFPDSEGVEGAMCMLKLKGADLLGLPLEAPLAKYETVYTLPMLTISMGKGTGVVTSVPADSPDDFACLRDWQTRKNWRDQYHVKEEWCVPFEIVPVLSIPDSEFGAAAAPVLVNELKIESHKDKEKLEIAKKTCYLKGFDHGIMSVGEFAGKPVKEAKNLVRAKLIASGQAAVYYEPEGLVKSRSGDECVVALCDQWYLTYGEEHWMKAVTDHLTNGNFQMFNPSALNQQINAVEWFKNWACSRTFGLGTRLPWDESWIIESLSDSTIYMAYYTIAHFLQGDVNGDKPGEFGLHANQVDDSLFDFAFCLSEELPKMLSMEQALKARHEFKFWYPMDLRVSGKDLIPNHLTMSLYVHAAIWPEQQEFWPRAFFCNGHVMIDAQKMSKSLGNFLTLKGVCEDFGADATRIALADAGDDLENSNFSRKTANDTILALTTLEHWIVEYLGNKSEEIKPAKSMRTGEFTFLDKVFENEMNALIIEAESCYGKMSFRGALKAVWFDMLNLRDTYKQLTEDNMHAELISRWAEVVMLALSPIAPHFCEFVWTKILGKTNSIAKTARFPQASSAYDLGLGRKFQVLQDALRSFRLDLAKFLTPKKGGASISHPSEAVIFVAKEYLPYQQQVLKLLASHVPVNPDTNDPMDKKYISILKDLLPPGAEGANSLKFAAFHVQTEVKARGASAYELALPFDEGMMLEEQRGLIIKQLGITNLRILSTGEILSQDTGKPPRREAAVPGKPTVLFL